MALDQAWVRSRARPTDTYRRGPKVVFNELWVDEPVTNERCAPANRL